MLERYQSGSHRSTRNGYRNPRIALSFGKEAAAKLEEIFPPKMTAEDTCRIVWPTSEILLPTIDTSTTILAAVTALHNGRCDVLPLGHKYTKEYPKPPTGGSSYLVLVDDYYSQGRVLDKVVNRTGRKLDAVIVVKASVNMDIAYLMERTERFFMLAGSE